MARDLAVRRELQTADFDYPFPEGLVAQRPTERREESRLLVVSRSTGTLEDRSFKDFPDHLSPGDVLVVNDSRVFPARLLGRKPTGAKAEVLLLRPVRDDRVWEALVRPGGKLKPGRRVIVEEGFEVAILDSAPGGGRLVRIEGEEDPRTLIERHGHVPLPPYLGREEEAADRDRYQTVYARHDGSVAAPTAGLHFTAEILARLRARGVGVVPLTLHVGVGTFRPVDSRRPSEHALHAERYRVSPEAAAEVNAARRGGGKVWAVGTTVVRVLETVAAGDGTIQAKSGWTDLFLYPSYEFRAVDHLLTNFHLPRSSLLMLVCAFGGLELTRRAYAHAAEARYRFYSYGDAMVVL